MADDREAGRRRGWWKVAIVLLLLLMVAAVVVMKVRRRDASGGAAGLGTGAPGRTSAFQRGTNYVPEAVLATVNSDEITLEDLENALAQLQPQVRAEFARQKHTFLEELIARRLLLQEADRLRLAETAAYHEAATTGGAGANAHERALIDVLLRGQVFDKVTVSDGDLRAFYEAHKAELPGQPAFEDAKVRLRPSLTQQKQSEALQGYVAVLSEKASVTRNERWIAAQRETTADNPLDRALSSGKPVLADFGRGTCIPCKMMKPILDELAAELRGRVHVLILDTGDYGYLAQRHRVRIIPTQIFFDASGKDLFRHEGFMSKEDIRTKLNELGML